MHRETSFSCALQLSCLCPYGSRLQGFVSKHAREARNRSLSETFARERDTQARRRDREQNTSCLFAWRARGPTQDQTTQMQSGNDWKAYISEDDRRERCLILRCKRFTPCKAIPNKSRCIKPELGRYVHLDLLWIALQGREARWHRKIKQRSRRLYSEKWACHAFPDCICVV